MNKIYGVYGASGFGREVMSFTRKILIDQGGDVDSLYFIDDFCGKADVNDRKIVSYEEFKRIPGDGHYISIAISDVNSRKKIFEKISHDGLNQWNICAKNSFIGDDVQINDAFVICPFVTITSNVRIGRGFQANIYSYVAHDCEVGDFVTFAPGVKCNGNVLIEDNVYIGTGAMIRQGHPGNPIVIGRGAVIGMGAVVTKSIPSGATVVGNPAKSLVSD